MRFIFSYAQAFKEKYACFTPQSSCKSFSEQIHIPFLSSLLFVLACISTHMCGFFWAPQKWRLRQGFLCTWFIEGALWGKWKWGEQGGAEKGAEQSSGLSLIPQGPWRMSYTPELVAPCGKEAILLALCQWVIVLDVEEGWAGFAVTLRQEGFSSVEGQSMVITMLMLHHLGIC